MEKYKVNLTVEERQGLPVANGQKTTLSLSALPSVCYGKARSTHRKV
jgi:hypothetical protein